MAQLVKSVMGLAIASVKSVEGLAIASVKSIMGLDNTSAGGGTVTLKEGTNGQVIGGASTTSYTVAHTNTATTNTCMTVGVSVGDTAGRVVSGVTYNGVALTQIGTTQGVDTGGGGNGSLSAWRLLAPATGANNVVITFNAALTTSAGVSVCCIQTWDNVNQTTPTSNVTQAGGNGTTATRTVTSATNSRVIALTNGGSDYSASAATNRNQNNLSTLTGGGCASMSDRAGSASEVMSFTLGSDSWAEIGYSLDP